MSTRRKPQSNRRNRNSEEMYAMGFSELAELADDEGWPYSDTDDDETTELFFGYGGREVRRDGRRDDRGRG